MTLFARPLAAAAPAALLLVAACGGETAAPSAPAPETAPEAAPEPAPAPEPAAAPDAGALLDAAIAGDWRSEAETARDVWRRPKETLTFFGVAPDMTVVEIYPGGGWYTNILAPYVASGGGVYYAAGFDPAASERAAEAVAAFRKTYAERPDIYGEVNMTVLGGPDGVAPAGSADAVLTFRNVHNWLSDDSAAAKFAAFYEALKPGGILGVVEHRADEDGEDNAGGYVKESTVKQLAADAGFEFVGGSEINANPADTKDHPFGVWTLPPVRRSTDASGATPDGFDREKYDAIGESDRMTLKFRKPVAE